MLAAVALRAKRVPTARRCATSQRMETSPTRTQSDKQMTDAKNVCGAQKVVLVVEDNETARWILAEILTVEGYAVCEASNADEAMQWLTGQAGIHAVISDIEMPGSMNGLELAARIHTELPQIAVLLTSGRHHPPVATLPPATKFVPKPWVPGEIIRELEALLSC